MTGMLSAANEAAALERLHELKCTDGLPVVVPTEARVARMALASGLDRDLALGEMGPGKGIATVEKVAVAAVMAGCLPDYMPLVIASVKAVLDPRFDLTEMQATTHCTAPLILVNGPARRGIGPIACGFGALGPGHRANASIGRALRLAMINIGGGRPGESDMALLGHPGKFTYCLGEDEETSPFSPLHVDLGFAPEDSTVTVIGAEAPHSVLFSGDGDDPESANRLLGCLAIGLANIATNNAVLTGGAAMVLLNPEHAAVLADAGLDRRGIAERLHGLCAHSPDELARYAAAFASRRTESAANSRRSCFASPDDILIAVAGGTGLYSMVMPTWCAGPHRNRAVSVQVEMDQFCEIPTENP
ncbi:MAG: hypothetical protein F4X31_06215 [Gammaproteobacteria bacterium]|nr:hypothetical protein [Gammaproteobacteria bacterium]